MSRITDEMVERGAQAYQAWSAPNTTLRDVGKDLAEVRRKVARLILEAALDNQTLPIDTVSKIGQPCTKR